MLGITILFSLIMIGVYPFEMNSLLGRSSFKQSPKSKSSEGTPVRIVEPSQFGMSSSPRKLRIDSFVNPSKAEGPSHLLQLRGHCFKLEKEDYTYELCPFYNISQREVSTRWNPYYGLLGVWSGWIFRNNSDYVAGMEYTHGDKCGEGYKKSRVMFQCSEVNNSLHWVNETERCFFIFTFLTQLVCRNEWRAVFPHLTGKSREDWLRAQLDHSLGYLTDKGVCHVKKEILKELGWVHELNLTRLRMHEEEKKNDQSLYDRTSFIRSPPTDCSKCLKELKVINNELNQTQMMLKQVNASLQYGVINNHSTSTIISSLIDLLAYSAEDHVTTPVNLTTTEAVTNITSSSRSESKGLQEPDSLPDELESEIVEIEDDQNLS